MAETAEAMANAELSFVTAGMSKDQSDMLRREVFGQMQSAWASLLARGGDPRTMSEWYRTARRAMLAMTERGQRT